MTRPTTLTRRALNRALLARQHLLERADMPAPQMIDHLIGVQAQVVKPPYVGLWSRLRDFQRPSLHAEMEARQVVRVVMQRSTMHLYTAQDFMTTRPVLQPAFTKALNAFFGAKARALDIPKLVSEAVPYLKESPRTFEDLTKYLITNFAPHADRDAVAYAVKSHLPLVQVHPAGVWGVGGSPQWALADQHLGIPYPQEGDLRSLFFRYLRAFGPASVMDFQTWAGMTKLKDAIEPLRRELVTYRDEDGRELFDLPNQPLPPEDLSAPARFVAELDNLILAHQDRTRVISDAASKKVFLSAARVLPTILLDGHVAGVWKWERVKKNAILSVTPFRPLAADEQAALTAEGERLIRFAEDDADTHEIRFNSPDES